MTAPTSLDPKLKEWASPQQAAIVDAIIEYGSARAAARALNLSASTVKSQVDRLRQKAAIHGYSPDHNLRHIIPAPFVARGHSTYYDRDGKPTQQWVKSRLDDNQYQEMLREVAQTLADELPRLPAVPAPTIPASAVRLANLFVLTDVHLGMLAWYREGGANWDLKIAERIVNQVFLEMMDRAPPAKVGIIAQLGDWLHSDSLVPITPTSGHVLDQDSRFPKIVSAAVRLGRRLVDEALAKYERVVLIMGEGNHDLAASVWLQVMFAALYENDPRVEVVQSPLPYYALQHGNTGLFFHHGHKKKIDALPLLFAAMFPQIWGSTTKRYAHTGHLHHLNEKEHPGLKLTQHPTIAARDAHAARGGWLSERQASVVTYHDEYGKVGEAIVTPEMLS